MVVKTMLDICTCKHPRWAHDQSRGACHTTIQHAAKFGLHRSLCTCTAFIDPVE